MKKIELVLRELLYLTIEKKTRKTTQAYLASAVKSSLSTVNLAISRLRKMGAVEVKNRSLIITNPRKILLYWASIRNLEKDILERIRIELPITDIEKNMPQDVIFGGYSAYKFKYNDQPADYSEVYIYSNNPSEVLKRFKIIKGIPNLFILKKEFQEMTAAHIFVDLWNLREWYTKEFLKSMEERLYGILE